MIMIGMTALPPPRVIKTAIIKMDSTIITKEGIEKLLTMLPTEEEKQKILEAQMANPDIPLGSAEFFLLNLSSISEIKARLELWLFKLDFETVEGVRIVLFYINEFIKKNDNFSKKLKIHKIRVVKILIDFSPIFCLNFSFIAFSFKKKVYEVYKNIKH